MKFTDLNGQQRSILTMLCTGQTFNTQELGKGTVPKLDAKGVAQVLMEMREAGLIFSSQKTAAQTYASWRASDYGKSVFENRPNEVPAVVQAPAQAAQPSDGAKWVVYSSGSVVIERSVPTEDDALARAAALTERFNKPYYVARLVAVVKPVTHTIERV